MIALITQRESVDIHGVSIDSLESTYINYFESFGIELRIISNFHQNIRALLDQIEFDLVILTGGGSIPTPSNYNEQQTKRDFIEKTLIIEANKRNIPILAICRGMQYVNTLYGGKVDRLDSLKYKRNIGMDHPVELGNGEFINVNNFHNDGILISNLALNFDVVAFDKENQVIEAYYAKINKILGLQWHPERKFEDQNAEKITKNIIKNFLDNRGILDESYYFSCGTRD